MGIFGNLFGGSNSTDKKEEKSLPWIPLTSLEQLDEIKEKSKTKTQFIYKHSTTCGISRMVLNSLVSNYPLTEDDADLYYLDLHSYRNVSNEAGVKFQVMHESPQLLIINGGVIVDHASHGAINEIDFNKFI